MDGEPKAAPLVEAFDHVHTYHAPVLESTFECWTATAALARDTSRIRLGQMTTGNGCRNPSLLAKMASTVDVPSHGRLDFGIGAGWYELEYLACGYPYPATGERLRMLGEAPQAIPRCGPSRTPPSRGRTSAGPS